MIRSERPGDAPVISALITEAFRTAPHADGNEAQIVEGLREAGALTLSLVFARDGAILGHVAFSPVRIDGADHGWYGLGPVAVEADVRKEGIGSALIHKGLADLRAMGAKGCVVLGEPEYYRRFGFRPDPALTLDGVPPAYFMSLPLSQTDARGTVTYHAAFSPEATPA